MLTLKFDEGFPVMISLKRGLQKVGHLGFKVGLATPIKLRADVLNPTIFQVEFRNQTEASMVHRCPNSS